MAEANTENTVNISNFSGVFGNLSKDQLRFVVKMQECSSKKDAAEELGLKVQTVYNWPSIVDDAIRLLALDIVESSRQMRKSALARAIAVKIAGLDSSDERVRQAAATEIIEAELGKATQVINQHNDGTLEVVVRRVENRSLPTNTDPETIGDQ